MVKKDRRLLILMTVSLSVMLILRDICEVSISKYLFVAVSVLGMAIVQYEALVYMVCFIMPLLCGLPSTYVMLATFILLILKKGKIQARQLFVIAIVVVLELIASFGYSEMDYREFVKYISCIGVMFFLLLDDSKLDYLACIKYFLYGTSVLCGIILIATFLSAPSNWLELFSKGWFRIGQTHAENTNGIKVMLNANSLGYYSLSGTVCGVLLIAKQSAAKKKILYFILTFLVTIAGFFTLSRSWLIILFICIFLYMLGSVKHPKLLAGVLLTIIGIGAIAFLYFRQNPDMLSGFISRMSREDVEGGNGRLELMVEYMKLFIAQPKIILMGTGVVQYSDIVNMEMSIHNGIVQMLVCYGIPGSMVILYGMIAPLKGTFNRKTRGNILYWMPIIGVVVFAQVLQFFNPFYLMFPYVIAVYALKMGTQTVENEIELN